MKHITREQKVLKFHQAMGLDIDSQPRSSLLELRKRLIEEETQEVVDAICVLQMALERGKKGTKEQWVNLLKELADLQYVLSGTVISLSPISGSFTPAFNRVHSSNMSKFGDNGKPIYREDGKVTKGPNYKRPKLGDLVYV